MKVDPQQFIENGYVIVRDCVPPGQLDELRDSFEVLVDRQRAIWRREREPNDPPGGVWDTHKQPRVIFDTVVDEPTSNTIEFCLHENTMGVARQLMRAPDVGVRQMAIMCNPVSDHGPWRWHRDASPVKNPPVEGLAMDMIENGPGYVQWNIPLYDDNVLWVVPGSHRRANTKEEELQLLTDPKTPLPGAVPVELKAGDGVVYTNFILHWASNYTPKLRRTIHIGYQSFGGPLYRYFSLRWNLGFTKNLPHSLRKPFEHWARLKSHEHDIIENVYRAMLDRDPAGFHKGLAALHPGENGKMVCVVILCKLAQTIHAMTRPGFPSLPIEEKFRIVRPDEAYLHEDVACRFTGEEIDVLWQRFLVLDAALQTDETHVIAHAFSIATTYRSDKMPADFEVDDFIESWGA